MDNHQNDPEPEPEGRRRRGDEPQQHTSSTATVCTLRSRTSCVTVETTNTVTQPTAKQAALMRTEFGLAVYFGLATWCQCWQQWTAAHPPPQQQPSSSYVDTEDRYSYGFEDDTTTTTTTTNTTTSSVYSILEQEIDVGISVCAYLYMTYETYRAYKKQVSTKYSLRQSLLSSFYNASPPSPPPENTSTNSSRSSRSRD